MKIVCDNCSAKYSIADEKVAGKVFKIRCKKCTNVIVVRGDHLGAEQQEEPAADAGFDYGGDQVWHIVVDGDQQGPYAPSQLAGFLTDGTIDWEAYVWKEGFDGWKPARDVPELVSAITGDEAPADGGAAMGAGAGAAGLGSGGLGADPFGDSSGDPFAGSADDSFGAGSGAFAGGAEAARASADAGADLFAQSDASASPFGGGPDDDVVASAPSPRVSQEQAMTGARNENSVLFSLSNLQALATGGPSSSGGPTSSTTAKAASAPAAGHATGEGSGLIDIRALASATASTGSGRSGGSSRPSDDLLSIGGGGGGLGPSLGAPVLAPAAAEPEESNKTMIVGAAIAGLLVIGLVAALIVVLMRQPEPVVQAAAPGVNTAEPGAATGVPAATANDTPATTNAGQPVTGATAEDDSEEDGEEESDDAEEDDDESEGSSASSSRRRRRSRSSASSGSRGSSTPEPAGATTTRMASSSGSLDDLLDGALSMSSMSTATAAAMSNAPAQPARDDVAGALRGVSSRVASCGSGTAGVATAAITFASSGRVKSVRVTGVPPAVQSCVSRGVRSARVPEFSRPSFNVTYPFRVR